MKKIEMSFERKLENIKSVIDELELEGILDTSYIEGNILKKEDLDEYEYIHFLLSDDVVIGAKNGKFALVDYIGNVYGGGFVYDDMEGFISAYTIYKKNNKFGFIDRSGKNLTNTGEYDEIVAQMSEHLVYVRKGDKIGLVSTENEQGEITDFIYDDIPQTKYYTEKIIAVRDGKSVILTTEGKELQPYIEVDYMEVIFDNIIFVRVRDKVALYDLSKMKLHECTPSLIYDTIISDKDKLIITSGDYNIITDNPVKPIEFSIKKGELKVIDVLDLNITITGISEGIYPVNNHTINRIRDTMDVVYSDDEVSKKYMNSFLDILREHESYDIVNLARIINNDFKFTTVANIEDKDRREFIQDFINQDFIEYNEINYNTVESIYTHEPPILIAFKPIEDGDNIKTLYV